VIGRLHSQPTYAIFTNSECEGAGQLCKDFWQDETKERFAIFGRTNPPAEKSLSFQMLAGITGEK